MLRVVNASSAITACLAKASRPGRNNALATLKRGDVLVALKLDRLGRSVQHLSDLLVRFGNDGIHFCSLAEGINTTTPGQVDLSSVRRRLRVQPRNDPREHSARTSSGQKARENCRKVATAGYRRDP